MTNFVGKLLVQLHLVISMLALGWAASLYFELVDWGWKSPRKDLDQVHVIASEYDKRVVHQKEGYRLRDYSYSAVKDVWQKVREAERYYVANSLWYDQELTRLAVSDEKDLEVRELDFAGGRFKLETTESEMGKPAYLEKKLGDISKSRALYLKDLKKIAKVTEEIEKDFAKWQDAQRQNTDKKISKFDANKRLIEPGLNDLRQMEVNAQGLIIEEMRYLEPRD